MNELYAQMKFEDMRARVKSGPVVVGGVEDFQPGAIDYSGLTDLEKFEVYIVAWHLYDFKPGMVLCREHFKWGIVRTRKNYAALVASGMVVREMFLDENGKLLGFGLKHIFEPLTYEL